MGERSAVRISIETSIVGGVHNKAQCYRLMKICANRERRHRLENDEQDNDNYDDGDANRHRGRDTTTVIPQ
jgi:hypothetical protein